MALDRLTKIDGGGISTTSDYRVGIITATKFIGPIEGDVTGAITATDGTFSGNVSIAGTLTYEDVTNIDSVGIITAAKDIHVGAGVSAVGVGTFSGLDISGDIDVDGHTNLDNVSIAGVTTITGILYAGSSVRINTTDDQALRLNSTDNGPIYMRFDRSGARKAWFGFGSATDSLSLKNEISDGDLYLSVTDGGSTKSAIHIDSSENAKVNIPQDLDVDGHTNLDNVSIAGVTTITGALFANGFATNGGEIGLTGTIPRINFTDSNANSDFRIKVDGGSFQIEDISNSSADRLTINSSGNVSINNDLDVNGHTNLDNVSISGVTTATTINATTFVGNGDFVELDVDGHTELDNVNISGLTTAALLNVNNLTNGRVTYAGASGRLVDSANLTFDGTNLALGGANTSAYANQSHFFIGSTGNLYADTSSGTGKSLSLSNNAYINSSGNWVYRVGDKATNIYQYNGVIGFRYAGTGSAGNTISWSEALRIDSSGRLLVNRTSTYASSSERLSVNGMTSIQGSSTSAANLYIFNTDTTGSGTVQPYIFLHDGSGIRGGIGLQYSTANFVLNAVNDFQFRTGASGVGGTEKLRINSDGQIHKRQDPTNRTSLKTYSGEGLWIDHYQYQVSSTYRRYADIASVGSGSWGSLIRFHTMPDNGSPTERLYIDQNGSVIVANGRLHASRVQAKFGIDCHGLDIYDGVGAPQNYGMVFYNDPTTNKANGIGFFNDDGQSCGGYIVHQDKGGSNIGDIIFATSASANTPVERLRIEKGGNLKQTLTSPSGTSPFQDSHWYDRDGGNYSLSTTDHDSFTAVRTSSGGTYDNLIYKRVKMSKNCDIEFDLSGNSPSGTYRHIGFTLNADGSNANYDRLVFRSRPSSTSSNQIRIDKANGGGYGFQKNGSYIPTFFDGTERHIIIQLRERLVNVLVDGEVIISEKNNADFYNSSGWFGFAIYEGGESAQVTIRNLEIRNKFQIPRWLVRASQNNVDLNSADVLPYNTVILASSDMNNTSHYNTGSYRFNVPISGLYYVFFRAYRNSSTSAEVAFYVNASVRNRFKPLPNSGDYIFAGSCLIQLMKGDYIDVRAHNGTFDNFYGNNDQNFSSWGGHLLD